jgi:hypothetical protein
MGISTIGGTCDCRCGSESCTGCCDGNSPDEWLATFTFEDAFAGCTSCVDFLNGDYVLTKNTDGYCTGDDCCWSYIWEGTHVADCDDYTITKVEVLLKIRCESSCFADSAGTGSEIWLFWFAMYGYYNDSPLISRATIFLWAYGETSAPYYHITIGNCDGPLNTTVAVSMGILFPADGLLGICKGGLGFTNPSVSMVRV